MFSIYGYCLFSKLNTCLGLKIFNIATMKRAVFSIIFNIPTFCPSEVPLHPQSISRPLNTAVITATVKMNNIAEIINEFSRIKIPSRRKLPDTTSIQGIIMAIILTNWRGNIL